MLLWKSSNEIFGAWIAVWYKLQSLVDHKHLDNYITWKSDHDGWNCDRKLVESSKLGFSRSKQTDELCFFRTDGMSFNFVIYLSKTLRGSVCRKMSGDLWAYFMLFCSLFAQLLLFFFFFLRGNCQSYQTSFHET